MDIFKKNTYNKINLYFKLLKSKIFSLLLPSQIKILIKIFHSKNNLNPITIIYKIKQLPTSANINLSLYILLNLLIRKMIDNKNFYFKIKRF